MQFGDWSSDVCSSDLANDEFKKMSLELSKPQGIKLNIFTVENTLTKISKIEALSENIMMIFGNTKDVRQFCEKIGRASCRERV